ncbi:MAG: AAA family ATPase, partial [Planctomycetaceae bacterium]|nr:AAA family ATPase [Planctomycetaceae bacterium]
MKLLELRLRNLNSLAGDWRINFQDPQYINNGLFTITGPTGAGKTTLLDAICLALYGRTPRLSIVSGSDNEIMSRSSGECFAEVSVQTRSGTYRATWSQRRARGAADGKLQQPRHELADHITGEILSSKLKETQEAVRRVIGLDYGQFTRSILLAQGEFAQFLQATEKEKSEILERITGTEIYSHIGQSVYERT